MLTLIFSNHWFIFWSRPTDTTHALFIPPFYSMKTSDITQQQLAAEYR